MARFAGSPIFPERPGQSAARDTQDPLSRNKEGGKARPRLLCFVARMLNGRFLSEILPIRRLSKSLELKAVAMSPSGLLETVPDQGRPPVQGNPHEHPPELRSRPALAGSGRLWPALAGLWPAGSLTAWLAAWLAAWLPGSLAACCGLSARAYVSSPSGASQQKQEGQPRATAEHASVIKRQPAEQAAAAKPEPDAEAANSAVEPLATSS